MSVTTEKKEPVSREDLTGDVDVVAAGTKIILPEKMDLETAIGWLQNKLEEENTEVSVYEEIQALPLEGAVALARVLAEKFGWTKLVPTKGFFGSSPPSMVAVTVDYNETITVPWGNFQLPGVRGTLTTDIMCQPGKSPQFVITGKIRRSSERFVHEIADLVRKEVRRASIYRGKALEISFRDAKGKRLTEFGPGFSPTFIQTNNIDISQLVLSETTSRLVEVNLFTPVRGTEICRKAKIPLKRGVLLEGEYGTGKTLTAYVLSRICVDNGWTFLYAKDVRDLDLALRMAKMYSPCVVFSEDVDEAASGDRSAEINEMLNTLDGVDGKNEEIMVCLTTNHVEKMNPAFMRPGRIDIVIKMEAPDGPAIAKLVRKYGGDYIVATDAQIQSATQCIQGQNAAFIREMVERSKLSGIERMNGSGKYEIQITEEDLFLAAKSMEYQIRLQDANKADKSSQWDKVGEALAVATGQYGCDHLDDEE